MIMVEITDDMITEHFARHPSGDDTYSDASAYPYTFLQGFRDAEAGRDTPDNSWSMAEANAYRLGRFEFKSRSE